MRILVADDDFASRVALQESLRPYGSPHIAVNGREAVDAVRSAHDAGLPYDLICLDLLMPEMDGLQALQALRAMEQEWQLMPGRRAVVVVVSSADEMDRITAARNADCDHYLLKPIDRVALRETLRRLRLVA